MVSWRSHPRMVLGEIVTTSPRSTATCASFSPDQRCHTFPWADGGLQANATIYVRAKAGNGRGAPGAGAVATVPGCSQRRRHLFTVSRAHPTVRAIWVLDHVGW